MSWFLFSGIGIPELLHLTFQEQEQEQEQESWASREPWPSSKFLLERVPSKDTDSTSSQGEQPEVRDRKRYPKKLG